jgi:hypothetical protein
MKYMLLVYRDESKFGNQTSGDHSAAYMAYAEALIGAGAMVDGKRLQPVTISSTVKQMNGKTTVLDGPYADSKEQLGGFFIIDVPDLDSALQWAARCPGAAEGAVEVRPVWPEPNGK